MSFDYAKSAASANRLLAKFGRQLTLISTRLGTYDPETASAPVNESPQTVTGVLLEYSTKDSGIAQQAGYLIKAGDRKLLMGTAGVQTPPVANDRVTIGTDIYLVIRVRTLAPAGVDVLYECQVRK